MLRKKHAGVVVTEASQRPKIGAAIDQLIDVLEKFDKIQRRTILMAVSSQLELDLTAPAPATAELPQPAVAPTQQHRPRQPLLDIRTLKDEKKPSSAQQMIAVAGYYVQEVEGSGNETFTSTDMNKLFKQAGYPLPKNMAQALINTKNAGYLDETATRGAYKLSRVGYNLVTHSMPKKKA
jgi:hypothetical protein